MSTKSSPIVILASLAWILLGGSLAAQVEVQQEDGRLELLRQWPGADGKPLPFSSTAEIEDFLRTARIVTKKAVGVGVNQVNRYLLEKDGVRANAVFRDVKIFKNRMEFEGRLKMNFRDDAMFEGAAYELGQMLAFRYIPPTVRRSIDGKSGTLQFWIEDGVMERDRIGEERIGMQQWLWQMQHEVMSAFDNLIYNEDRNQENILYTPDGKMILIDHTRAFRLDEQLLDPAAVHFVERNFYERLKALDPKEVRQRMAPFLSDALVSALLKRRKLLVEHIDKMIEERGERRVLFIFPAVEN